MALLPVDDALKALLEHAQPLGDEWVPLKEASGRILSQDLISKRTHPPFNASAMDGYAVKYSDAATIGARLKQVGESAAGKGFHGTFQQGECVRIFTGAPVPHSADTVLIQENTQIISDNLIEVTTPAEQGRHIRPKGYDFQKDEVLLNQGRKIDFTALTLAASMNYELLPVFKKPKVAILATGDELVNPGQDPGLDQIIASNSHGIMALCDHIGAHVTDLGIAHDHFDQIEAAIDQAIDLNTNLLVTIGGASVGNHDLVQQALKNRGMDLNFWKIAMRPGKPLMFGTIGPMRVLGLPGNPASSLVTSILFLSPLIKALAGDDSRTKIISAATTKPLKDNDRRQDYLRSFAEQQPDGTYLITPFDKQDSSLMSIFAKANALLIRPPFAPLQKEGDLCDIILFN